MKHFIMVSFLLSIFVSCSNSEKSRTTVLLDENWKFIQKEVINGAEFECNDADWETVPYPTTGRSCNRLI